MALNSEEILILIAAILGGITLASLVTLLIARCLGLFSKFFDKFFPEDAADPKKEVANNNFGKPFHGISSRTIPSFKIPGKISKLPAFHIQPAITERCDSSSEGSPKESRVCRSRSASIIELEESEIGLTPLTLQPELYVDNRRKTIGFGTQGKIRFSLQYDGKSRRNLKVILRNLESLRQIRQETVSIFVKLYLLPERESAYKSKTHFKMENITFEDEFLFTSRPMNRDFESKCLRFTIHFLDRSGKEHDYGEARMPLLCREIYSQIETELSLNIKPFVPQNEVGDIMLQLSYSSKDQLLSMSVKSIKFPHQHTTENLSAIYFRSYIKRNGEKVGRKHSFNVQVQPGGLMYFDATQHADFKLKEENFLNSSFRITIIGKHKVLRKNLSIGKVFIGASHRDEAGIIHWKTILSSPELTWTVWHPVYNS